MREPEKLKGKLAKDRNMRSAVDALIADFEPWFRDSKLPFFPDYTDHGINHVEDVLTSATSLVSDNAWKVITAQDAGILIIATLLHDCALHLTEDGFIALITGQTKHHGVRGFDNKSWPELWNDFLFSAMRYDDRTIEAIFGQPVTMRRPPLDASEMTQQDRKLIGEFLRRHHGRLAHEIALTGVPSLADKTIRVSDRLDSDLADLAGLIGRSHSLPLRSTFGYLGENFHQRSYRGVHAIYLMVLLRIADYLQIQSERAPKQMLQVKRIQSPISRQEWNAHGAVVNIVPNELDPESILIQAKPRDVKTYLRLKEWLEGIQSELDTSWAVLGEVYAPVGALRNLGLVLRRVRSNLDDEETFAKQAPFVPKRIEFDIARAETLKLLIRPLYGDKPEIGIRELVQNAVDAVRELWDLQEQQPELRNKPLIEQEADVVVWVDEPGDDGFAYVIISDRGVGMTEAVIRDYFLKAGASFRYSEAWAKQHEQETYDESGIQQKSRVLRTGRFGIGVLAAFLLGDYLEVETRHVTSASGLRFVTRLDPDVIELRYDETLNVGTTVRIRISSERYESLIDDQQSWDWYCLEKPSVLRLKGHERMILPQDLTIPGAGDTVPIQWHLLDDVDFERVHWSYSLSDRIVCNGIYVQELDMNTGCSFGGLIEDPLELRFPLISVFDPNGNLPLDLTRSRVDQENTRLFAEMAAMSERYLLAYLLANAPTKYELRPSPNVPHNMLWRSHASLVWPWFYTKEGVSIVDAGNIHYANIRSFLILSSFIEPRLSLNKNARPRFLRQDPVISQYRDAFYSSLFHSRTLRHDGFLFKHTKMWTRHGSSEGYARSLISELVDLYGGAVFPWFPGFRGGYARTRFFNLFESLGLRILVPLDIARTFLDNVHDDPSTQFLMTHRHIIELEWENGTWALIRFGDCPSTVFDLDSLDEWHPYHQTDEGSWPITGPVAEWFIKPGSGAAEGPGLSSLFHSWREVIGHPVIPYDLMQRRKKLAKAYEVLDDLMRDFEVAPEK
ncbi:MAG: ATP-binding protein [Chloroflexota bacterium]|nr:ATP-binding protein [Chloroflexota bacterium]